MAAPLQYTSVCYLVVHDFLVERYGGGLVLTSKGFVAEVGEENFVQPQQRNGRVIGHVWYRMCTNGLCVTVDELIQAPLPTNTDFSI